MFLWPNRTLLELFRRHMPETSAILDRLRPLIGRGDASDEVRALFETLPASRSISASWRKPGARAGSGDLPLGRHRQLGALDRALEADAAGNVVLGRHTAVDSTGCVVYAQSATVATLGVSDLVVVEAYGKVLVCSKAKAAELKKLVAALAPEEG